MVDPSSYQSWLDRTVQQWVADHAETTEEQARDLFRGEQFRHDPLINWQPGDLEARIIRELAPIVRSGHALLESYRADGTPGHHLVDIQAVESPEGPLINLVAEGFADPSIELMLGNRVGLLSPSARAATEAGGIEVVDVPLGPDALRGIVDLVWHGKEEQGRWDLRWEIQHAASAIDPGLSFASTWNLLERTPFGRSMTGVKWLQPLAWHYERPYVVVIGNSHDDFCLWSARDRMYWDCSWIPFDSKEDLEADSDHLTEIRDQLNQITRYGYESRRILLVSLTLLPESLDGFRDLLGASPIVGTLINQIELSVVEELPYPSPRRLFDPGHLEQERYEAFSDDEQAGRLVAPISTLARGREAQPFTWFVDALVGGHQVPPRSCLNELVTGGREVDRWGARSGSEGVSFYSQRMGFIFAGSSIEQTLASPQLRLPSPDEIFSVLLARDGLTLRASSAGQFAAGHVDLWGGLENLAQDLMNEARFCILTAFRSKTPSEVDPGVFVERRRFLSIENVVSVSGLAQNEARSMCDDYLARGILRRGLILQCQHCRYSAWYDMEDLTQDFRCKRCRRPNHISQATWKQPLDEPNWYYQLDELVLQSLEHEMHVPLLALRKLRGAARSFQYLNAMDVYRNDDLVAEVDLFALVDGEICVGEAKKGRNLGDTETDERNALTKMLLVADAATADQLIVATAAPDWTERTLRIANEMLVGKRARLKPLVNIMSDS